MKFHDTLNQKLFNGTELKPEVKDKLNEIADAFEEYLEIPKDAILDRVLTGSSVSYNYTDYSDIDLHLVVDYDKVHEDCPIVEGYLWALKADFNKNHDIFIYGIPVELYAEQKDNSTVHNGLYSLTQDKWIDEPEKIPPTDNDAAVKAKFEELKDAVDKCDDSEEAEELTDKIYAMRKAGLQEVGEFSTENMAFKELRNAGCLDKLKRIKKEHIDKQLSLESYNEVYHASIQNRPSIQKIQDALNAYKPVFEITKGYDPHLYKFSCSEKDWKEVYNILKEFNCEKLNWNPSLYPGCKGVFKFIYPYDIEEHMDKQLSLELYNEDFQKLSRDDFKIVKTEDGYFKVDGKYDSRIGYIEPSKDIQKVDRALGNAIYKYNTKFIQEDRKALISKLHKLLKQAGIPKMKDTKSSIRGYRPITQNGYYVSIPSGDKTSFDIGLSKSNDEYLVKIKEILDSEGIKYWEGSDYFSVDMEKQNNKNESIREGLDKMINKVMDEEELNKTQQRLQRAQGQTDWFTLSINSIDNTNNLLNELTPEQLKSYVIIYSYFNQYAEGVTGANRDEMIYIPYNWSIETLGWKNRNIPLNYLRQNNKKSYSRKGKSTGYGQIGAEQLIWKVMTLKQAIETYNSWQRTWLDRIKFQPLKNCLNESIKEKLDKILEEALRRK